jgi:hypothetical protein
MKNRFLFNTQHRTLMKHLFYSVLLCCLSSFFATSLHAQDSYYWSGGEKISLKEDRSTLVLHFKEGKIPQNAFSTRHASSVDIHQEDARMIVHYAASQTQNLDQLLNTHTVNRSQLRSASFGWVLDDGFSLVVTHEVVLQYASGQNIAAIQSLLDQYGASYARTEFETIIIDVPNINNVLPLANALRESGMTRFAHPDFYAKVTHYNDPLFSQQFQMNNTGQTIDGFPGAADADCNAPEAWATTLGSSSVVVAVIDDGVEDHEDLNNGSGVSRLIGGYTPLTGGNGTPNAAGDHGEACAGIIAASHNGIGVQGLAPETRLLAVNIFAGSETSQDIANGITWAKNNGADVMSNSWGYTSCTANFSNLTNAINDAVNNGRGGLGCVVVFASGNGYKTCVDYPADLPSVIAVGAFGNDGIISDYSNEGPTLDIVAPSNDVSSQGFLSGAGVRTIDRMGSAGYSSGNYTTSFGGTSAACPVVAGVAALVLAVDPGLTDAQVKSILYSTAIDMGSSGFDNTYGNGRVNAGGAVAAASGGGGSSCSSTINSFPYTEGFEGGTGAWTQSFADDLDWSRNSGGTPSSGTGPASAAEGSWYMYVEASSPNYPSKNTLFTSPCFDMSGLSNPQISFQYHMLGTAVGTLALEASLDGTSWTQVWSLSGDQGSSWNTTTVGLSAYAGNAEVSLRFSGTTASSWQGDLCIDDITVEDASGGGGDTQPPTDPTGLTASNTTQTTTDLTWNASTDNVGVTGYNVYIDGSSIGTVTGPAANITGLTAATTYAIYVTAIDAAGNESGASNTINVTTSGGGGGGSTTIFASFFETGLDGWTDGGSDCARINNATNAWEGNFSMRIRDNTNSSVMTSPSFNGSQYASVDVEFYFRPVGMENGEDFWLQVNTGSGYTTVATYTVGSGGISNNNFYVSTVNLTGAQLGSNMVIRFRNDASVNNDQTFIDAITVTGNAGTSSLTQSGTNVTTTLVQAGPYPVAGANLADEFEADLHVYPSPAEDRINIATFDNALSISLYSIEGKLIRRVNADNNFNKMDVSDLASGIYMLQVVTEEETLQTKFSKK